MTRKRQKFAEFHGLLLYNFHMISPKDYIDASPLARETEKELMARLDLVVLKPKTILDIGCGPGLSTANLRKRYPDAEIYGVDHSESMLEYAKTNTSANWICEDAAKLPFKDKSIDFIFSNLLLYPNAIALFEEWFRVLRPEGLLMFSSFGQGTLQELAIPEKGWMDMHHLGDLLLQKGFKDPVVDVDVYQLKYRDRQKLTHELYVTGMVAEDFILPDFAEIPPLSFEIVYGHAWGGENLQETGVVKIPLSSIKGLSV